MANLNKPGRSGQLIIAILVAILLLFYYLKKDHPATPSSLPSSVTVEEPYRNISHLIYTKHARCRMGCRHIDEGEVKEIIQNGKLNENKSGRGDRGDETYALEGVSQENQKIRVVVSPQQDGLLVITVIDLEHDWSCHCD